MKTQNINLVLAAEFSNLPSLDKSPTPEYFISKIKSILKKIVNFGSFKGIEVVNDREVGQLFTHRTYIFNYGERQVEFSLLHFHPASRWEVKGFRVL